MAKSHAIENFSLTRQQGKTYALALGEFGVSADFINFPAQRTLCLEGNIFPADLSIEPLPP